MGGERMLGIRVSTTSEHEHSFDAMANDAAHGILRLKHRIEGADILEHGLEPAATEIGGTLIHPTLLQHAHELSLGAAHHLHARQSSVRAGDLKAFRSNGYRRRANGHGAKRHARGNTGGCVSPLFHQSFLC